MDGLCVRKKLWVRFVAVFLIGLLALGDISYALDNNPNHHTATNLIPTERTGPLAFVEETSGGYSIKDDAISIASFLNSFKKRYEILYMGIVLGEALANGIDQVAVKAYAEEFLHAEAFKSLDINGLRQEGNTYVAPYCIPETKQVIHLRFCLDPEDVDQQKPSVNVGKVVIVVEDYPGYDADAWSGTFYFDDIHINISWDDLKEASHLGVFDRIKGLVEAPVLLDAETEARLREDQLAETDQEGSGARVNKRAYLDTGSIMQATLLALLYIVLGNPQEAALLCVWHYLLPALAVSVFVHEAVHWLKIKRVRDKKNFFSKFHVGMDGVYFDLSADNDTEVDMIILAGMVASGTLSTIFSVASLFSGHTFFVVMGIVNAAFAFSGRDVGVLRRRSDFARAPAKIYKKLKRSWRDMASRKSIPSIILIGGYFAAGKGVIARMVARFLRVKTDDDVYVINGDSWLLSDRRRVKRAEEVYPYNAYELDKWKTMVKRASEGLPIFVPFYMTTFRMRMKVSDKEFFHYQDREVPVSEDGYRLLYANDLRERPIKDFFPAGEIKELIAGIERVWAKDNLQQRRILKNFKKKLNSPLGRYLINPNSEVYIDYATGDILERMPVKGGDTLIMEFEQALMDDELSGLADVRAFVDASMIIRTRYFLERRKKGLRYADLDGEGTAEKFKGLRSKEDDILPQKAKADIVVENNQHLQDVVFEDLDAPEEQANWGKKEGVKKQSKVKRLRLYEKADVSYSEIARMVANKGNINEELSRRRADVFMKVLQAKALAAKKRKQKLLLGIDTSWIPEMQKPFLQGILSELNRLKNDEKFSNVEVVVARGTDLAAAMRERKNKVTAEGKVDGFSLPMSNVSFVGHWKVLGANEFKEFKLKDDNGGRSAFFVELALAKDFPHDGFVDLMPILNFAVTKGMKADKRFHRILLESGPFDLQDIKDFYDIQLDVMTSA